MKKSINILAKSGAILLSLMVFSCQNLKENPISSLAPSNYFTNPSQCESAYAQAMSQIYSQWSNYAGGLYNGQQTDQTNGGNYNYSVDIGLGYWTCHFQAINTINTTLATIKSGSVSTFPIAVVNDLIAQGRFLRAFNYFYLVRLFGKVPYITEDTPNVVDHPLTPSSREEIPAVYDKIQADLVYAGQYMNDYNASIPGHINKWTARALLSKVYLTRATAPISDVTYYPKARDLADTVITQSPYGLQPTFDAVFSRSNRGNLEIIFAFNSAPGALATSVKGACPVEIGGFSGGSISNVWSNTFPEQPRKHSYIMLQWPEGTGDIGSATDSTVLIPYTASVQQVPNIGKQTWPYFSISEIMNEQGFDYDLAIIRFADVLLMYAEAANMANGSPTQVAVDRVNMIINRANAGTGTEPIATLGMSSTAFDALVINERNFELCFEGDRYYDLVRKRMIPQVCTADQLSGFTADKYLYPIPSLDAPLVGQNPGY